MTPCLNYTIKLIPKSGMEMFGSATSIGMLLHKITDLFEENTNVPVLICVALQIMRSIEFMRDFNGDLALKFG